MPRKPPPLPPIPTVTTLDGVIDAIGSIIDWSIKTSSRLGYFAALYKRITIAVDTAIAEGKFQDGARVERFDVAFADRYFAALNGHFHPRSFPKPTRSWRVTFDAASRPEPIIVQHMLGGVNAHIGLDLGIVAEAISPGAQLPELQEDFNRLNAVLAGQVDGVVDSINELSPVLADFYAVLKDEQINLINEAVKFYRDTAWLFAVVLAASPGIADPAAITLRDFQVEQQGFLIYNPGGAIATVVNAIAARESRDVVTNIRELDRIASELTPITTIL